MPVDIVFQEINPDDKKTKKSWRKARQEAEAEGTAAKFPRIVLKGVVGQELDTDTSYQRVINEAKWRMSMGEQPMESEDWRLPHATLPARPDYSREPPPGFVSERLPKRDKKRKITTWESLPDLVTPRKYKDHGEIDHKKGLAKLSFNLGQLETLPPLVAATLLHQEIQRKNQRTYIPFVASAPVYNKPFSATDIREPVHEIPGFCSGCLRQELCYGCAQEPSKPHYHRDKPSRTGGGFTYYKRDKAHEEFFHKNPLHWKDGAEPNSYVFYEDEMAEFERYALKMKVGQVPLVPRPQMNRILEDLIRRHHSKMARIHAETVARDRGVQLAQQDVYKSRRTNSPQTEIMSDVDSGRGATVADSQEMLYRSDLDLTKTLGGFSKIQEVSETDLHSRSKISNDVKEKKQEDSLKKTDPEKQGSFTIPGTLPPIAVKKKEKSKESLMEDGLERDNTGKLISRGKKAGSPSKKPLTVPMSPFSSNREYSIPRGEGFSPIKSSKSPTKFEDFEHLDRSWKEPKKFELEHPEKHSIEPWLGLKQKSSESVDKEVQEDETKVDTPPKERTPSIEEEREVSRPASVDSGVASQPPTDRAEDGAAKFEATLPPVPPTPSSGHRSRQSHSTLGSRGHTKGVDSPLRVDGEGTFISRSESALVRERSEMVASAGSKKTGSGKSKDENGSVRSVHTIASVTIQQDEPTIDVPETIESKEPTQDEIEQEEKPEPEVIEEPQQEVSLIQEVVEEEVEEEEVETDEAKPKGPGLDWSKFKKGAMHYTEEEDKKQADKLSDAKTERDKQKSRATVQTQKSDKSKESTTKEKKKKDIVKKESKKERKRVKGKKKEKGSKETKDSKKTGKSKQKQEQSVTGESEDEEEADVEEEVEDLKLAPIKEFVPKAPSPPPSREVEPPPLPKLEPVTPPELPDYDNPERPSREVSKTLIEAPPIMPEPPKQRRPADLKRVPKRKRDRKRVLPSQNVAPVSKQQLKTISNPLDYLAKYCIIHPDRLPHYERVFNNMIREQVYRYSDVPHPEGFSLPVPPTPSSGDSPTKGTSSPLKTVSPSTKTELTQVEKMMIKDLSVITRATKPEYGIAGMNEGDQLVAKLNYTLDTLIDKYENISEKLDDLQAERVSRLARLAKKEFPGIDEADYVPPGAKKKKKKKKDKPLKKEPSTTAEIETQTEEPGSQADQEEMETAKMGVSDLDIVSRLDQKMLNQLTNESISSMEIEIRRLQEKLKEVDDRIEYLEDEKKLFQIFARDEFQDDQVGQPKPKEFTRKQSALFNKMHPPMDAEMNLTELEEALQQLNTNLISEKEMQYIYHILDLPGRKRINVQLFSVIAALSEKVAQVDPLIKKLINKFDFEALDVKMEKCKGLFDLLDEDDFDIPSGMIKAKNLVIELAAGGIAPENTSYIESKFNRESRGIVDFLDFLTYVPLFIEIHERIIAHPLSRDREL